MEKRIGEVDDRNDVVARSVIENLVNGVHESGTNWYLSAIEQKNRLRKLVDVIEGQVFGGIRIPDKEPKRREVGAPRS